MNLPNKLTMLRVLLIPVFMVCAANRWMLAAGIIFAAASLTDYFDGHLARKNNLVTDFGKFADPLADKLLTTTAFLYMLVDGVCDPVVLAIILAREFAVSGLRMVAAGAPGGKVIAANMWGKVKTALQMLTIVFITLVMRRRPRFPRTRGAACLPRRSSAMCCAGWWRLSRSFPG